MRTRISHPVDRTTYGPSVWSHILRDQLEVTDAEFWGCVQDGVRPDRGHPEALPADLVHLLIARVGLGDAVVAAMTRDEAIARLQQFWTEGN